VLSLLGLLGLLRGRPHVLQVLSGAQRAEEVVAEDEPLPEVVVVVRVVDGVVGGPHERL
jgi:hypothetical protein